jgi:hypothetical protein
MVCRIMITVHKYDNTHHNYVGLHLLISRAGYRYDRRVRRAQGTGCQNQKGVKIRIKFDQSM